MEEVRKDSIVFYRSWLEVIDEVEDASLRLLCYESIVRYGLDLREPKLPKGYASIIFKQARPLLDVNYRKWLNGLKGAPDGNKGGAPRGNKNASKQPQNNPKTTPNENDKENDNENDKENESENDSDVLTPTKIGILNDTFQDRALIESEFSNNGVTDGEEIQKFIDYYSARGWKINGVPIKDISALVRTWIHRMPQFSMVGNKGDGTGSQRRSAADIIAEAERIATERTARIIQETKRRRGEEEVNNPELPF